MTESLDDILSKIWSDLNKQNEAIKNTLDEAYAIYGQMLIEGQSKDKITEQREHCQFLRGLAQGWTEALDHLFQTKECLKK